MKRTLKIIAYTSTHIFIAMLGLLLSAFAVVFAGDWLFQATGMDVERVKEILAVLFVASYALITALCLGGGIYWSLPLFWEEHKRRKHEAEEERRAAEVKMTGGSKYEHEGKV